MLRKIYQKLLPPHLVNFEYQEFIYNGEVVINSGEVKKRFAMPFDHLVIRHKRMVYILQHSNNMVTCYVGKVNRDNNKWKRVENATFMIQNGDLYTFTSQHSGTANYSFKVVQAITAIIHDVKSAQRLESIKKGTTKGCKLSDAYYDLDLKDALPVVNPRGPLQEERFKPREHVRRGYYRRKKNSEEKIWIEATTVNKGIGYKITKRYIVKGD